MKIVFVPGTKEIEENISPPEPASFSIPDWYKNIPGNKDILNVKRCIPFLDSITNGYIQKTWSNIYVENNNGNLTFSQDNNIKLFHYREKTDMPIGNEFYNIEFIWQRVWSVVLPKNFSAIVTHPINRIDLPFITISGIVDFDKSLNSPIGNIPFFIKNGFEGVIPIGTPMFQIIPFERFDWKSENQEYNDNFWNLKVKEQQESHEFYKKKIWHKKRFD